MSSPHRDSGTASTRRPVRRACYVALWLAAFLVRLVFLWESHDSPLWSTLLGDARVYDQWARDIAAGDWLGHDVFYQAPAYPYFLAAIYRLYGPDPGAARIVQCLLGATACVLLALAGRRIFSPRVGWLAGLGLALCPAAIFHDGLIQKTSLAIFLLCLLLSLVTGVFRRPDRTGVWLLAGSVLGLLALTQEHALSLAAVTVPFAVLAFPRADRATRMRRGLWHVAGIVLVLLPVAVRNRAVGGEWHLTTAQFGPNLYIGNHASADGFYDSLRPNRGDARYERLDANELAEQALGRGLYPGEVSRYWTRRTLDDVSSDPLRWLALMLRKSYFVFHAVENGDTEDQYTYCDQSRLLALLTGALHFGVLLPIAAFGLAATWRNPRRTSLLLGLVLVYAGTVALFYVFARYRLPLVPPLLLLAAAGLYRGAVWLRRGRWSRFRLAAGVSAVVAVAINLPLISQDRLRAITRANLAVHLLEQDAPFDAVAAQFEASLQLDPDQAQTHLAYANYLAAHDRAADALPHYASASALDPLLADAHNDLGNALGRLGRRPEALDAYRRATEIEPGFFEARYNLGYELLRDGRAADAAAELEAAVLANGNDFEARHQLGRALIDAGRPMEAVAHLRAAVQQRPDLALPKIALGHALEQLGQREEALREYRQALELVEPASKVAGALRETIQRLATSL
jgi:Flp pilus assembly protein TadD/4-amino-4-deoxy-L-arabinose transferase-like glycosyltransferase